MKKQSNRLVLNELAESLNNTESSDTKMLQQAFSNIFNAYAKTINKVYRRTGSLFQERFGRKIINDESYYTRIVFYIQANPQKHGLVNDFTKYSYTSYSSLLSDKPTLLKRN